LDKHPFEIPVTMHFVTKYLTPGDSVFDVACGTGRHLKFLKESFSCTGVDLNEEMLKIAKKNVKGIKFKQSDMVKMNLNIKFDIITCLFSSIGYVKTYSNLQKTINNFSAHLFKGGVLIIEPWFEKSSYRVGFPHLTVYDGKDIKIARVNISKRKGNMSILDMHYLVAEKNKDVKYFTDRHEMGMFEVDRFLKIMEKVGFRASFLKKGIKKGNRGVYLGIKK